LSNKVMHKTSCGRPHKYLFRNKP